jgi:hypothetical protein
LTAEKKAIDFPLLEIFQVRSGAKLYYAHPEHGPKHSNPLSIQVKEN